MGREARAAARYGDETGMVTALLEGDAFVMRGEIRASVPRSALHDVVVEGGELRFLAGDVPVVLTLGTTAARRWAMAIASGPPTLEVKLGIDASTRARVYGTIDDDALDVALATAAERRSGKYSAAEPATLVLVRANGGRELEAALEDHLASSDAGAPLWVVYRKGKDVPLNEAAVRAAGRARDLVDTKIAGISRTLSALRFTKAVPPAQVPHVNRPFTPLRRVTPSAAPKASPPAPRAKPPASRRKPRP